MGQGCGKSIFAKATFGEFAKEKPGWITVEIQKAHILKSPLENIDKAFSEISRYQVDGVVIEDIDALMADLDSVAVARRLLIESIKKLSEKQLFIATARYPQKMDVEIFDKF